MELAVSPLSGKRSVVFRSSESADATGNSYPINSKVVYPLLSYSSLLATRITTTWLRSASMYITLEVWVGTRAHHTEHGIVTSSYV